MDHENEKLAYYTEISQRQQDQEESDKLFLNMSIKEILAKVSTVFIEILGELLHARSMKDVIVAVFKADRMIYIGLIVIFIAFSMYIVDITG